MALSKQIVYFHHVTQGVPWWPTYTWLTKLLMRDRMTVSLRAPILQVIKRKCCTCLLVTISNLILRKWAICGLWVHSPGVHSCLVTELSHLVFFNLLHTFPGPINCQFSTSGLHFSMPHQKLYSERPRGAGFRSVNPAERWRENPARALARAGFSQHLECGIHRSESSPSGSFAIQFLMWHAKMNPAPRGLSL